MRARAVALGSRRGTQRDGVHAGLAGRHPHRRAEPDAADRRRLDPVRDQLRPALPPAALAALLLAAGCSSGAGDRTPAARVPAGPPNTIRVALSDFRWPLDPALAATRDELTLARALYATPLRTDSRGRVRPGLCSAWTTSADFRIWRFRCRDARAIAAELRRVGRMTASPSRWLFAGARVDALTARTLVVRLP